MAVPTMYSYLLTSYARDMAPAQQAAARRAAAALRLAVSGSAACPVPILEQWRDLSGQVGSHSGRARADAGGGVDEGAWWAGPGEGGGGGAGSGHWRAVAERCGMTAADATKSHPLKAAALPCRPCWSAMA